MKKKIISIIGYILVMGFTLLVGSWVISLLVERSGEPKDFERGYFEGYEQGLSEDYWSGWDNCRMYFREHPQLLE